MCCCSYRTFARELIDLALGKAEFAEETAGIGTEHGWRRRGLAIAARQAESRSHDAHWTIDLGHGLEGLEQSSLENLRMLEHGWHVEDFSGRTPFLLRSADHSCADRAASARSSSAVNSNRRRLRSSRPEKRGSAMSSSRPINRHSISNCSCLFAAMFKSPSPVRNVPEGLAVIRTVHEPLDSHG